MLLKVVTDIFQEVGKDVGPFGEKKIFWKIFSQRGPLQLLALPFGQHRGQIFFPKSFFYSLVVWRALKSGYGHFPRGREGYRTIWRKKFVLGAVQREVPKAAVVPFGKKFSKKFFFLQMVLYPSLPLGKCP